MIFWNTWFTPSVFSVQVHVFCLDGALLYSILRLNHDFVDTIFLAFPLLHH